MWYRFSKIILAQNLKQLLLKMLNGNTENLKKVNEATKDIRSNKAKFVAAFYINRYENVGNIKFYLDRLPNTLFDNLKMNDGNISYQFQSKWHDLPDNFNKFAEFIDENFPLENATVLNYEPNTDVPIEIHPINDVKDALKFGSLPFPRSAWCITWPMHKNNQYWNYRKDASTFYIVIDNTRDIKDKFYAVAVDALPREVVFTTFFNGSPIKESENKEMYDEYFDYLRDAHAIDKSIFVNKPLTDEEIEIQDRVSDKIYTVEEFHDLKNSDKVKDLQKRYIEYPHALTLDQLEYLIKNKENQLINTYCNTTLLSDEQIKLLKENNRNQDLRTSDRKENKIIDENIHPDKHVNLTEVSESNLRFFKKLVDFEVPVLRNRTIQKALDNGDIETIQFLSDNLFLSPHIVTSANYDSLTYILDNELEVAQIHFLQILENAFMNGDLDTFKLCEKYVDIDHPMIYNFVGTPNYDLFVYLLSKGIKFKHPTWRKSAQLGFEKNDLRIVDLLSENHWLDLNGAVLQPINFDQFEYLLSKKWQPCDLDYKYIFEKIFEINDSEYMEKVLNYIKSDDNLSDTERQRVLYEYLQEEFGDFGETIDYSMLRVIEKYADFRDLQLEFFETVNKFSDEQIVSLLQNSNYLEMFMNSDKIWQDYIGLAERLMKLGVDYTKSENVCSIFRKMCWVNFRRKDNTFFDILGKFYDSGVLTNCAINSFMMGIPLIEYFMYEKEIPLDLLKKLLDFNQSFDGSVDKKQFFEIAKKLNAVEEISPWSLMRNLSAQELINANYKNFNVMFQKILTNGNYYDYEHLIPYLQESDYLKNIYDIDISQFNKIGIMRLKELLSEGLINVEQLDFSKCNPTTHELVKEHLGEFLPTQNLQQPTQNLQQPTQNLQAIDEDSLDLSSLLDFGDDDEEDDNNDNNNDGNNIVRAFNLKKWIEG